ncbi:MAG: tetratricopeptide repeat protein [Bacteroidales bacterium]
MSSRDDISRLIENQELDKALELVSGFPEQEADTWYLKGKVYSRMGKMSEALSCYIKALDIDPNHGEAAAMIELSNRIYSFKDPNRYNH